MTSPFLLALLIGGVAGALGEFLPTRPGHRERDDTEDPPPVGFGLAAALLAGTVVFGGLAPSMDWAGIARGAVVLSYMTCVAAPMLLATLLSDTRRRSSERHAISLVASGALLVLLGFSIPILSSPTQGTVAVSVVGQYALTIMWLLLLTGIVEMVSLVPKGVELFAIILSVIIWRSTDAHQSVASYGLAGVIAGGIIGHEAVGMFRRSRQLSKTEVFAVGLWLTALTNLSFMKSLTFAGFVLPVGGLAAIIILLALRGFERSLILREAPR